MTLRPSLQKSITVALDASAGRRLRLSAVIGHAGGRRTVDLIVGDQRFSVLVKDTPDQAREASASVIGAAADLIESLGGTAEIA